MANHYILDGASGADDGSNWTDAWDDLPANLTRGDTYYIGDGNYAYHLFDDNESGTDVITIKKSTVADHGTETGYTSTDHDGRAVFAHGDGQQGVLLTNACWGFREGYYTIDGQVATQGVYGSYGFRLSAKPTATEDQNRINIGGGGDGNMPEIHISYVEAEPFPADDTQKYVIKIASQDEIDDSSFNYIYSDGQQSLIKIQGVDNLTIDHCYTKNSTSEVAHHGAIINLGQQSDNSIMTNVVIRYCIFEDMNGTGAVVANDNGVVLTSVDGLEVYGNVFAGMVATGSGGGFAVGAVTNGGLDNAVVYNNTFYSTDGANKEYLAQAGLGGTNLVSKNNVLYNMDATINADWDTSDYNHYVDTTDTPTETNSTTGTGDPFTSKETFDFTLVAATDAGDSSIGATYNTDILGETRGADGTWDRGAYEFVSGDTDNLDFDRGTGRGVGVGIMVGVG